jgi:hypothetical protein
MPLAICLANDRLILPSFAIPTPRVPTALDTSRILRDISCQAAELATVCLIDEAKPVTLFLRLPNIERTFDNEFFKPLVAVIAETICDCTATIPLKFVFAIVFEAGDGAGDGAGALVVAFVAALTLRLGIFT